MRLSIVCVSLCFFFLLMKQELTACTFSIFCVPVYTLRHIWNNLGKIIFQRARVRISNYAVGAIFCRERSRKGTWSTPPPSFSGQYCSSVSSLTPKRETEVLEICSSIPPGDFCQSAPVRRRRKQWILNECVNTRRGKEAWNKRARTGWTPVIVCVSVCGGACCHRRAKAWTCPAVIISG